MTNIFFSLQSIFWRVVLNQSRDECNHNKICVFFHDRNVLRESLDDEDKRNISEEFEDEKIDQFWLTWYRKLESPMARRYDRVRVGKMRGMTPVCTPSSDRKWLGDNY